MTQLFEFLETFKSTDKTFTDELDKLYYSSFVKGEDNVISKLKEMFPESHEFSPKDLVVVKNELDAYITSRTELNQGDSSDVKGSTEKNGFLSGQISLLNEAYIYLQRYSSVLSSQKAQNTAAPATEK